MVDASLLCANSRHVVLPSQTTAYIPNDKGELLATRDVSFVAPNPKSRHCHSFFFILCQKIGAGSLENANKACT